MASAETIRFEDMRKGTRVGRGAMLHSSSSIGLRHRVRTRVLHPLLPDSTSGGGGRLPVPYPREYGPASSRAARASMTRNLSATTTRAE